MATIYGTNGHDNDLLGGGNLVGTSQGDLIYGYNGHDCIRGLGDMTRSTVALAAISSTQGPETTASSPPV